MSFVLLRIRGRKIGLLWPVALLLFVSAVNPAAAQNNYEIQVYGSDTVAPNTTMLELHSNFTVDGSKPLPGSVYAADQLYPTNHAEHETLEITQGINNWSEVGFYVFTSARSGQGWQWVGDHIRPRVRAPDSWHWPVGVSLSTEIGYQRRVFSTDTWTWEIRPIVDKQIGRWYFAFNPAFERTFHGPERLAGGWFCAQREVQLRLHQKHHRAASNTMRITEVCGDFYTFHNQQQQFFPAIDLNVSPNWEINFGVGVGVTAATDHLIVKGILGRRFDWTHHRAGSSESTQ